MWSLAATMTQDGYNKFGKRFIQGFLKHWPQNATLWVLCENFKAEEQADNLRILDLYSESPELLNFKKFHSANPFAHGRIGGKYMLQFDVVKWSHRIFALAAVERQTDDPVLINIDSDICTFADVPEAFLNSLLPPTCELAYMPRKDMYSECSFVLYRMNDTIRRFIKLHVQAYMTGSVFSLPQWTDCNIFDSLLQSMKIRARNINAGVPWSMHPFVNGPLGQYMDHLKGSRKELGQSKPSDLVVDREEEYWRKNVTPAESVEKV